MARPHVFGILQVDQEDAAVFVDKLLPAKPPDPDPLAATALRSSPSSADESGRAATLRAEKKVAKYEALLLAVGGLFRAAVVERFGAVGDSLAGLLRLVVGDAERMRDADDYSFTAQRQVVWAAQHVVFSAVMGDAAMLDAAMERDVYALTGEAAEAARARVRGAGARVGVRARPDSCSPCLCLLALRALASQRSHATQCVH